MKKFILFAAAVLTSMSMMAQTTLLTWQASGTSAPANNAVLTATGGSITVLSTDASKSMSVESAAYAASVSDDMKALNGKGFKMGSNVNHFCIKLTEGTFQEGDSVFVCGYKPVKLSLSNTFGGELAASIATGSSKTDYQVGVGVLAADADSIILNRAEGTGTAIAAIKIVRPAPSADPTLNASVESIDLKVTPFAASVSQSVVFSGKNLAEGSYSLVVPSVDGMSVNPSAVTVDADGNLKDTVVISYTSTADVAAANASLSLTIGELSKSVAIAYSARVTMYAQESINGTTEWDWAKAASVKEIRLTDNTNPSKLDTIVYANADGINNDDNFNSQALRVRGEYLVRDSKYFQGDYISFNTTVAGTVTVVFSNTGSRNDGQERYLNVNGAITTYGSKAATANDVTAENIAVAAGKVELTWTMTDGTTGNQYARVYKVIFTEGSADPTAVENIATEKAQKVMIDGQMYIIKNGVRYNVLGAVVK